VFTDGMSPTYMVDEARAKAGSFESTWGLLMSLPYRLSTTRPRARSRRWRRCQRNGWPRNTDRPASTAVEVNPAMPGLLARGTLRRRRVPPAGLRLFIDDARRYLADTCERYDLIRARVGADRKRPRAAVGEWRPTCTRSRRSSCNLRRLTPTGVWVLIHSDPGMRTDSCSR